MRIVLLANRDVHACVALNLLAPALAEHDVAFLLSDSVGGAVPRVAALRVLRALEQTIPNDVVFPRADEGRNAGSHSALTFTQLAATFGTSPLRFNDPNSPDGLLTLQTLSPDLIVSLRFGKRLQQAAIATARHGVLNLHSGRLPQYRGVLATMRALLAGDAVVGCTLHWITDASIDTGPVIAVSSTPVSHGISLFDAIQSVYPDGVALLAQAITTVSAGKPLPSDVQVEGGHYFSWPDEQDFYRLESMGHVLYDPVTWRALLRRFLPPDESLDIPLPSSD